MQKVSLTGCLKTPTGGGLTRMDNGFHGFYGFYRFYEYVGFVKFSKSSKIC